MDLQDLYVLISLGVLGVTIAGVIRFFSYTTKSLQLKRTHASLLAIIAKNQNPPSDQRLRNEIEKAIRDNGILDEVPFAKFEDERIK